MDFHDRFSDLVLSIPFLGGGRRFRVRCEVSCEMNTLKYQLVFCWSDFFLLEITNNRKLVLRENKIFGRQLPDSLIFYLLMKSFTFWTKYSLRHTWVLCEVATKDCLVNTRVSKLPPTDKIKPTTSFCKQSFTGAWPCLFCLCISYGCLCRDCMA